MFVNTLVVRAAVGAAGLTFGALVAQVKRDVLEAFDRQDVPFDEVVKVRGGRLGFWGDFRF